MRRPTVRLWLLMIGLAIAMADAAGAAQGGVAELRGRVVDESGAALPGATITLIHRESGAVRTTVGSETGAFVVPALPVGSYSIRVELSGFSTLTQENVRLAVGESANMQFALKLGLLSGTLDTAALARLISVAAGLAESTGDPGLDTVLAEIELRVEVELAKIGMPQSGRKDAA